MKEGVFLIILDRNENESARSFVIRTIRENIVDLNLKPGFMMSEKEIASQLDISRTPVREALIDLSNINIVEVLPQKGFKISYIDCDIVNEVRSMRLVLEKQIIENLCKNGLSSEQKFLLEHNLQLQEFNLKNNISHTLFNLDEKFHYLIFSFANKTFTYNMVKKANVHFDRVRNICDSDDDSREFEIVKEHTTIYNSILNGDVDVAISTLTAHLNHCKVDKDELYIRYPEYFYTAK